MVGSRKKKPAKARKQAVPRRLKPLVEFLNLDLDDKTKVETVNDELQRILIYSLNTPKNLRPLQNELKEVLLPIARLPEGGSKRFKPSGRSESQKKMVEHLNFLVRRLNDLKFEPKFGVYFGEKEILGMHNPSRALINREQGIFSSHSGKWIIKMDFSSGIEHTPAGIENAPRKELYGIIAEGLLTGELARLRQCGYCKTFFVAQQPRFTFCPGHARLYYDRPAKIDTSTEGTNHEREI